MWNYTAMPLVGYLPLSLTNLLVIGINVKRIISNNCLLCDTRKSSTLITFRCLFLMDMDMYSYLVP